MAASTPIIRQTAWISIIPHLAIMGLIILAWYPVNREKAVMYGALTYLGISFLLRSFIPKNHRRGIALVKAKNFEGAIQEFEKSYAFFSDNEWVDKYRFITVLNSNKMTYKEMALTNIAYCHGQMGNGQLAKKFYTQVVNEYPDNELAKAGLKMLESMTGKSE